MVTQESIFIGANRQTQVADFDAVSNVVAFGAGETIALWNPLDPTYHGVLKTLKGHKREVTCVKFVKNSHHIVSASEDFQVRIWKYDFTNSDNTVECVQVLDHHNHTITALTVLDDLMVVGCADGTLTLWCKKQDSYELCKEFVVQEGVFPLCLALNKMEDGKYILAVGGTNSNIFIFSLIIVQCSIHNVVLATKLEGHEDWIKCLSFREQGSGDYLLASGSQDRYIRLWRIRTNELIDRSDEDESKLTLLSNKQFKFDIAESMHVAINFEALIMGHDDWISSLQWHSSRLQLLASTADTAIMVWEPDEASGIWVCSSRLGEFSSKGASTATGSSGGFWSCLWFTHDSKDYILTNGKTGAWRVWFSSDGLLWEQRLAITGATKPVTDVSWSINGSYLLSTSLDKTTRLYAKWVLENDGSRRPHPSWNEFARPQIHGYDMICVEPISNTRFVSGGDEKIMRSFDEPKAVSQLLNKFCNIEMEDEEMMPESAALPALGLSNKATTHIDEEMFDEDPDARETAETKNITFELIDELHTPPLEEQLQRHTLWPEVEKLYGHGYEISCLDVSHDKQLIATACKSNNHQHAAIRIFDTSSWSQQEEVLSFHNLTITRLRFSKDNKYLLSVSRDRQWALWERDLETNCFSLKCCKEKPHVRIIWDADWAPLAFGNVFATASRDKTIKIWRSSADSSDYFIEVTEKFAEPVTAISIHPEIFDGKIVIAVGLESGAIAVFTYNNELKKVCTFNTEITPAEKISRLRWSSSINDGKITLGVGSLDTSTRIYSMSLDEF